MDGRKGKMVDINFMYFYIMNSGKIFLDYFVVKVGFFSRFDIFFDVYFGLVKVKVYLFRGFFFFVLFFRVFVFFGNIKRMFILCRICV